MRTEDEVKRGSLLPWACALSAAVLIMLLIVPRHEANLPVSSQLTAAQTSSDHSSALSSSATEGHIRKHASNWPSVPAPTAEEIVADKLARFGKSRLELVHALARHFNTEVPDDVQRFFAALQRGKWDEIDAAHQALLEPGKGLNEPRSDELHKIWRPIQEAWGAAREAHDWPAQRLLDYGEAVLGSLRPGMIYVGGTDPGCFIPTFLNETSDGERHITMTQNALADGDYLNYLSFAYAGQMNTLTEQDSQRGYNDYITDAQKRFQHDQEFPDEPKQLRPGEDVRIVDGRTQITGQIAVMAINEKLFQILMEKNPDASFAMEESFPFPSTYSNAVPFGPITELRVPDSQNAWTADRAAQAVDYWRATAEQLATDPADSDARKAYSKMICAQAGLLLDHRYASEAEQAFRIADEMCPSSPEVVFRYIQMLIDQKRFGDAVPVAERAVQANPDEKQFSSLLDRVKELK